MSDRTDVLEAAGVTIGTKDGRSHIPLRCGALDGTCCSVYADRPVRCGLFTCALYRRHEAGEVTEEEALAIIAKTRALQAIVHARLAAFLSHEPDRSQIGRSFAALTEEFRDRIETAADPEATREANSLTLMYVSAFDQRISRLFRNE